MILQIPAELRQITPDDDGFVGKNGDSMTGICFIIGTDGDIRFKWATGREEVIPSGTYTAGVQYFAEFSAIMATGTTASNILVGFTKRSA